MSSSPTRGRLGAFAIDRRSLKSVGIYVVMYGMALVFLLPYAWMVSMAFKTEGQVFSPAPHWIPDPVTLRWFDAIVRESQIVQWTINTAIVAVVTTVVVVVIDSMIAFALTKLEWPGRRALLALILASFLVPVYVNVVPLFDLITTLGWTNTLHGVFLPLTAGPLGVFLFVQFFKDVPDSVVEAARLDGFSPFQIYLRIVVPLMKPAITALGLYTFVWSWNRFLWPLVVASDSSTYTLPVGIVTIQPTNLYQPSILMVGSLVAALPLFALLLGLQEYLVGAIRMQADT